MTTREPEAAGTHYWSLFGICTLLLASYAFLELIGVEHLSPLLKITYAVLATLSPFAGIGF